MTGRRPKALDGPECPFGLVHVWNWWRDLSATRRSGWTPEPIGYADIMAWALLTDSRPRPAEVGAIVALDRAFLDHIAKRNGPAA